MKPGRKFCENKPKKGKHFLFQANQNSNREQFWRKKKKIKQVSNWGRRKSTKHVWIMVAQSSYSKFKKKKKGKIFQSIRENKTHAFSLFPFQYLNTSCHQQLGHNRRYNFDVLATHAQQKKKTGRKKSGEGIFLNFQRVAYFGYFVFFFFQSAVHYK